MKTIKIARSRMRGVSLIEIMISLVIGLVVIGAVLVSYLSSGQGGRLQTAYGEMNENAQLAVNIMSRELQLAGYSQPLRVVAVSSKFDRATAADSIFGCDQGFSNPTTTGSVACSATGTTPAFEVVYEADATNTVPTSAGVPTDCLRAGTTQQSVNVGAVAVPYYPVRNRFYIATNAQSGRPELYCASNRAGATGQPLIDDVESMKIWYGVSNAAGQEVARYVNATTVGTDWPLVVSVRICLIMRGSDAMLSSEDSVTYRDCDSTVQTITDRIPRRVYFTTVTLRNRMPL